MREVEGGHEVGGRGERRERERDWEIILFEFTPGVPELAVCSTPHHFSYGKLVNSHIWLSQFALGVCSSEQEESIWHEWVRTGTLGAVT